MAEQDPFDRLDLGRQMLVLQPEADRAVAYSDGVRKLFRAPPAAGAISRRARAGAAQQMPTEELPEALSRAVRPSYCFLVSDLAVVGLACVIRSHD